MYLPKSKYTIKTASYGQFYLSGSNGKSYVGPYIEDYLGRTFAGTDILEAEKRILVPVTEDEPVFYSREIRNDLTPTEEDFITGSYTRYFRQNKYSKVIEEITEDRLEEDGPYRIISGTWIVTGSLDDRLIYGIPYKGVRFRNGITLRRWDKEMPGLSSVLNLKPEDFVREIK